MNLTLNMQQQFDATLARADFLVPLATGPPLYLVNLHSKNVVPPYTTA